VDFTLVPRELNENLNLHFACEREVRRKVQSRTGTDDQAVACYGAKQIVVRKTGVKIQLNRTGVKTPASPFGAVDSGAVEWLA
jgi:hypothetical protein